MSIQTNFSENEWELLNSTPQLVGSAIASAASSGFFGTLKEGFASIKAIMDGVKSYPNNELIQSIAINPSEEEAKARASMQKEVVLRKVKDNNITKPAELTIFVLEECRTLANLLTEKVEADTALEYKEWLLEIANKVAEAAKEGGTLFGIGGTRVSESEETFLQELEDALEIKFIG